MKMVFIMRKDLHMSPGKLATQVAHGAEAYWMVKLVAESFTSQMSHGGFKIDETLYKEYICGDHKKTVCEARNKTQLLKAQSMAKKMGMELGTDYGLIADKCYTELTPEENDGTTITGIWFKPMDDEIANTISHRYQLYK